jgi:hypothetical protein
MQQVLNKALLNVLKSKETCVPIRVYSRIKLKPKAGRELDAVVAFVFMLTEVI